MGSSLICFKFLLATCLVSGVTSNTPFKVFEYKFSFKPPYLSQKDGTIPFWEHTGNAIASEENLRITPSLRSQKGSVWSKLQTTFDWWEVEITFRVTGRGRIGADGLAFWYTQTPGKEGPVFGSTDMWNGLGVFFDSFDNDNKHNNPYIMAIVNDGTKVYDHQNDGATQQTAGCLRDFRNKPFPVRAKISYYRNTLTVMINNGMSNAETDYELCMRSENVFLPSRGHFGISAATGGLADDHDVQKFLTYSLYETPGASQLASAEQQRFDEEFQQYQSQLKMKKEEYLKEHPEAKKEHDEDDWFEEEQTRELRQIFQGQSDIRTLVQSLSKKLDEIVGRQENTISLVSRIQSVGGAVAPHGDAPPGATQQGVPPPIQRHEVDNIIAASRELLTSTREMKNLLLQINQNSHGGNAKPGSYGNVDVASSMNEVKQGIAALQRDVNLVSQRVHSTKPGDGSAPPVCPTSCITPTLFIIFTLVQVSTILGYLIYKSSKEAQAKKFY